MARTRVPPLPVQVGGAILETREAYAGLPRSADLADRGIMPGEWTAVRIRGSRGLPALDGASFLSCVSASREEACAAARIHHLAGCTFASHYDPFRRVG
jgi:hypothetical protein